MPPSEIAFEILFYERLLQRYPNHIDALKLLGEYYTKQGRYEDALPVDQRLAQLQPDDPVVRYNLACSLALTRRLDESLHALQEAMRLGYDDFSHLERDPDLASLRSTKAYRLFKKAALRSS